MDYTVIVTLLTIAVVLLSISMVTFTIVVIVLLARLAKVAKDVGRISSNLVSATNWLSPAKLFSEIYELFKK